MKRRLLFFMLVALFVGVKSFATPIAGGTYTVGGTGANYASLNAAATAIRTNGIAGDITLLICADIAENANIGLVNNTDYSITIRPNAAVKRTLTFGSQADNAGPSGHLMIGYNLSGWAATPTKNIFIDGSYNNEGQYLEFVAGASGGIVACFYGHVTNSYIKNCRLINGRTSGTNVGVVFRVEQLAQTPTASDKTNNSPENIGLENCYIQVSGRDVNSNGIQFNGTNAKTANTGGPTGCYIRDCEIHAHQRGIHLNGINSVTIERNIFHIQQTSSGYLAVAILGGSTAGTISVKSNRFIELVTANKVAGSYGMQGISASGSATMWEIENNYFAGMDATASTDNSSQLVYIRCGNPCTIRHNTFYMPSLSNKPATSMTSANPIACVHLAGANTYVVKNNIFVSAETEANNSLIRGTINATNVNNNIYFHNGGNAAIMAGGSVYKTWEEFTTKDAGSKWKEPAFRDAANGDLSFTASDADLLVTKLDAVGKDIMGSDRANPTYAGAFEYVPIHVSAITISPSDTALLKGKTATLTATVTPANATEGTLTWASDNTSVATVNASGVVTAVNFGTAHITATQDGVTSAAVTVDVCNPKPHIYAYNLNRVLSTSDYATYTFSFETNTNATSGNLVFYKESDGSLVDKIAIPGTITTAAPKEVVLTKSQLPACDEPMTWGVELTGTDSKVFGEYLDYDQNVHGIYCPRGMAVNTCTESDNFGKLYITNTVDGLDDGSTARTKAQKTGLYVYSPQMAELNPTNVGYTGGVSWNTTAYNDPYRVIAGEDGTIYLGAKTGGTSVTGVWMVNDDHTQNFSKIITANVCGFEIVGTGSSRVLYTLEDIGYDNGSYLGNLKSYAFGSSIPYAGEGLVIKTATQLKQCNAYDNIVSDGRGGFWISQNRGSDIASMPALIHISSNGTTDFNSPDASLGLGDTRRGSIALNRDKTRMAISANSGNIYVYDISYNGSGVPTLTKIAETVSADYNNIDGLAFDYVGNLFVVSASKERIYAYALPIAENTSIVPAKAALTVTKTVHVPASGIELNKEETSLVIGASETLVATILPTSPAASDQVVTWESDDEDVVTVSASGEITAQAEGYATITATTHDGGFTATCEVTVTKIAVNSISLNYTSYDMPLSGSVTLTATLDPENASFPTVTWVSSHPSIATVNASGKVQAVAEGSATITATADGKSATCDITVHAPVAQIYAYDLRCVLEGSAYKLSFKTNIPYTAANIIFYDDEGQQYSNKLAVSSLPVSIERSSLPADKNLTWAVEATAASNLFVGEITDATEGIYNFYHPRGVAVDNSTESDYFGQIYITEPLDGASDGMTSRTKAQKAGLFVYNPKLEELNTTNQGYKMGLSLPVSDYNNFKRVNVDAEGNVYVNSTSGIYKVSPANFSTCTTICSNVFTKINSFTVNGVGDDLIISVIDNATTTTGGKLRTIQPPFTAATDVTNANANAFAVADNAIVSDGRGGWWVTQHRYSADGYNLLSHISATGVVDYMINNANNTALAPAAPVSYRGAIALNREGTLLAIGGGSTATLYNVSYSGGIPSLTKSEIIIPKLGTNSNVDGLAFDYAGNLYIVSASTERLYVYSLPKVNNTCIVPAKSTQVLTMYDPITLNEADENTSIIEDHHGETLNVTLQRTFSADVPWYTLVLPFDVPAEQMQAIFGSGYRVAKLEDAYMKTANALLLRFADHTAIEAGVPCLFHTGQDITEDIVFHNVTIDATDPDYTIGVVTLHGLYDRTTVEANEANFYLGTGSYLYPYSTDILTNAFRAYFDLSAIPNPSSCSARIVFQEDAATEMDETIAPEDNTVQKVIRDGQLLIIRNGQEYTIDGRLREVR